MSRKGDNPVTSFGAALQATLRRGANAELRIKFDTPALATRFAHRIHALRAAMKKAKHPDWEQLYRCGVHKDEGDPRILILAPKDSEFHGALREAGIEITDQPPTKMEYTIPTPAPGAAATDPASQFLATLREATEVPKKKEEGPDLDKL